MVQEVINRRKQSTRLIIFITIISRMLVLKQSASKHFRKECIPGWFVSIVYYKEWCLEGRTVKKKVEKNIPQPNH